MNYGLASLRQEEKECQTQLRLTHELTINEFYLFFYQVETTKDNDIFCCLSY